MNVSVVIVGAGPAGLAAAEAALAGGAEVVLVDLNERPGGQYHRELPEAYRAAHPERVQHDWADFRRRRDLVLGHPRCRWLAGTFVFMAERRTGAAPTLHLVTGEIDGAQRTRTRLDPDALILATGAHDRVVPFPGWTLPGVYTAGAAQTLARTERVALGRRAIVSGTGPFLLPVAQSLSEAGTDVLAVLEANTIGTMTRGWLTRPHLLRYHTGKTRDLTHYAGHLLRHRIPFRTGRAVIRAIGSTQVEAAVTARLDAQWRPIEGTQRTVEVDTICVGHGFTPALELADAAGCRIEQTPAGAFVAVDDRQRTSVPGVYAAGEITGIGGSQVAAVEGEIAGSAAAAGGIDPLLGRKRDAARDFVDRLAAAHPLRDGWHSWPAEDTPVCRCENTTLAQLRAEHSADDSLRSLKLNTRAGLGQCQGRFCGANVESLCAGRRHDAGDAPGLTGARVYRRPIAQPVRLGEIAALASDGLPADAAGPR